MAENAGLVAITVILVLVLILLLYFLLRHFGFKRIMEKIFGFKTLSDNSSDEERSILSKYEQFTDECVEDSKEQFAIKARETKTSPSTISPPYRTKLPPPQPPSPLQSKGANNYLNETLVKPSIERKGQMEKEEEQVNRPFDLKPGWMKREGANEPTIQPAGWTDFTHSLKSPVHPPQFRCIVTQHTVEGGGAADGRQQQQQQQQQGAIADATRSKVNPEVKQSSSPSVENKGSTTETVNDSNEPPLGSASVKSAGNGGDQLQSPSPSRVASPRGSGEFDSDSMLLLDDDKSSRRTSISSIDSTLDDASLSTLTRALSTDSVDSTYSMTDFASDSEAGQLEVRLQYDSANQYLFVWILQAYDVRSLAGPDVEMWVVLFLLPHPKPLWRTQLKKYSTVISFHEKFRQRVRDQDLKKLACLCQLYSRKTSSSHHGASAELLGQAKVRLKDVDLAFANTLWLTLLPVSADAEIESNGDSSLGEILFSLNYLPTAERLTVVIAKVRNLRDVNGVVPKNVMVRVYLVQGAKVSRKKTSSKTVNDGAVAFNESMIFSLSQNLVTKVSLRLSVVELAKIGEQNTIGQVTVGARRTGKEFGHWQKMIEQPRKPASMWHSLMAKKKP